MPYCDGYVFSIPRGYAPIVISDDCYPRQEGEVFKGWGHTEVATRRGVLVEGLCKAVRSLVDAITCFAAGEKRSIVAHSGSITPGQNKPAYLYRSIDIIASWRRSLSEQLLAAMLRIVARPYYYSPRE